MTKILVVDDEVTSLALLKEMLRSADYEVVTATNGKEALDVLDNVRDIRAVVTDLKMPHINGLRFIRDRREAGDMIPIIAISGVAADQLILAEDYGANATLFKPVDRDKLLAALERALGDSQSMSGAWIQPE